MKVLFAVIANSMLFRVQDVFVCYKTLLKYKHCDNLKPDDPAIIGYLFL